MGTKGRPSPHQSRKCQKLRLGQKGNQSPDEKVIERLVPKKRWSPLKEEKGK